MEVDEGKGGSLRDYWQGQAKTNFMPDWLVLSKLLYGFSGYISFLLHLGLDAGRR